MPFIRDIFSVSLFLCLFWKCTFKQSLKIFNFDNTAKENDTSTILGSRTMTLQDASNDYCREMEESSTISNTTIALHLFSTPLLRKIAPFMVLPMLFSLKQMHADSFLSLRYIRFKVIAR